MGSMPCQTDTEEGLALKGLVDGPKLTPVFGSV